MKNHKVFSIVGRLFVVTLVGPLAVAGCGYLRQGKDTYEMYRAPQAAQLQKLNPEAAKNRKVVAGLHGPAAQQVEGAYVKSFERTAETKAVQTFAGLAGVSSN